MTRALRASLAAFLALSLAACAAAPPPQADLTPPTKRCDAKTQLENGKCPVRR